MQAPPQVIFVNRFYWPDETATAQLLTDLAEALAGSGHAVTVIASRPGGGSAPRAEERRRVRIVRVGSSRSAGSGLAAKAVDFTTFWAAALWRLLLRVRPGDAIVVLTDPPLLGVGVAAVAGLRGARCFHWIQDIYPDVAVAVTGRNALRALTPARNAAWRRAAACVTIGRDMAGVIAAAGIPSARIHVVPNWAPAGLRSASAAEVAEIRASWGRGEPFIVAYSGNLGRVHDLGPVLDVADALRADEDIAFVFAGSGARRPALEGEATRRGLARVRFRGPQPRERLAAALAAGDVHLVTLLPGCETCVFPSKIYGVAAAGRPVVFIGPRRSEMANLVVEGGFGLAFERSETAELAQALRSLAHEPAMRAAMGAAALKFAASGGAAAAAEHWSRLLASPAAPIQASSAGTV